MIIAAAAVCSLILDMIFGDPAGIPHPVVLMGRCITFLETHLRRIFPQTARGEYAAGLIMAALLPLATLAVTGGVLYALWLIHPALYFAGQTFWGWQALAMRGLKKESENVRVRIAADDLPAARKAVARIVGRDTENLSREGVIKAAVETVAENFSDGVMAPLMYLVIGGAPLALCYKAVNTMDSMTGYRNERYLHFGRAAAHLDDAVNYLPSRISALILISAAFITGQDWRGARRIWRRDRRKHASPNSAQTESVMAGALGVQLAGPASYFGVICEKPVIGDPLREVAPEDITRADSMLYCGGILGLIAMVAVRILIIMVL